MHNLHAYFILHAYFGKLATKVLKHHTIIRAAFVCLFVVANVCCSLSPPRSFDGSSPNLVGVCRWTSELPLRGSFSKKVNKSTCHFHFHYIIYAPGSHHTTAKSTWRLLLPRRVYFLVLKILASFLCICHISNTRKYTRRASKRRNVLFAVKVKVTRWPVDLLTFSKKNPSGAIPRSTYIHPPSLAKIRQRTSEEIGTNTLATTNKHTNAARIIVWFLIRVRNRRDGDSS